jgi:hypothetical protein
MYIDDPLTVPTEELLSRAGVVLDAEEASQCTLPKHKIEAQTSLQTAFPYYNPLSIMLAVSKCYSALGKACKESGHEGYSEGMCVEVYERDANKITFHVIKS